MSKENQEEEKKLVLEGELNFLNPEMDSEVYGIYVGEKSLEDALVDFLSVTLDRYGEASAGPVRIVVERCGNQKV